MLSKEDRKIELLDNYWFGIKMINRGEATYEELKPQFDEIEKEFDGKGYGDFKMAVGETVADGLEGVRNEYARLVKDKAYLEDVMKKGAETASYLARKTLSKVYRKVGFYSVK